MLKQEMGEMGAVDVKMTTHGYVMAKIGKESVSPRFLAALDEALNHHELVKVKFDEFKEQKKELPPQLAKRSGSHWVTRVGNVVVLYRTKPEEPHA
jgi:RNA-binding protein